jgi:TP901 family phage tail tape measure protein
MSSQTLKGITIEIGGSTKELNSALRDSQTEAKNTTARLKEINTALKYDPKNVELLALKHQTLGDKIKETKDKLETLRLSASQFTEEQKNSDQGAKQWQALQTEIIRTEGQLKSYQKEYTETDRLGATLTSTSKALESVGEGFTSAGNATKVFSAAAGAALATSIKFASNFEDALGKVETIADTSKMSMSDIKDAIEELSISTGKSTTELAEATYQAISASVDTADAVDFVADATKLAKVGFSDTTTAVDVLTTTINAYGMEASDASKISDMLVQTQNDGKTTVAELGQTLGTVIPSAAALNVNLENVSAAMAQMTKAGINTSEATTYLKGMLNELSDSGSDVSAILQEKTGKTFGQLMESGSSLGDVLQILSDSVDGNSEEFKNLWSNTRAGTGALSILNQGVDSFNDEVDKMANSTGLLDSKIGALDTTSSKINKILNALKVTAQEIGDQVLEALLPILEKLKDKVQAFSEWFKNLDDGQKQLIAVILAVVTALSPVLLALGKISTTASKALAGLNSLRGGFSALTSSGSSLAGMFSGLSAPVLLAVAAIAAVIAIVVNAYNTNEDFRNQCNAMFAQIKEALSGLFQVLQEVWNYLSPVLSSLIEVLTPIVEWIVLQIGQNLVNVINILKNTISFLIDFIKAEVEIVKAVISGIVSLVTNFGDTIKNIFTTIKNTITSIWTNIKTSVVNAATSLKDGAVSRFTALYNSIKNVFSNILSYISGMPSRFLSFGKSMISSLINGIKALVGSAGTAANKVRSAILNAFSGMTTKMWNWGVDMIQGLIGGITAMISKVKNAAKRVANAITSFLHFSKPDEGPLREYEKWMPDMMQGLAEGITKNKKYVTNALQGLTSDMAYNMQINPSIAGYNPGVWGASTASQSQNVQNLKIGDVNIAVTARSDQQASDIADEIQSRLTSQVRRQQIAMGT